MNDTEQALKRQKALWSLFVVGLVVIIGAAIWLGQERTVKKVEKQPELHAFTQDIDPYGFTHTFSNKVASQEQALKVLETKVSDNEQLLKAFDELKKQNRTLTERINKMEASGAQTQQQFTRPGGRSGHELNVSNTHPDDLYLATQGVSKNHPQFRVNSAKVQGVDYTDFEIDNGNPEVSPSVEAGFETPQKTNSFQVHHFQLAEKPKAKKYKNIRDTIPANSFVKAVLNNGVDVSASESSQKNPKPVILTVTGWMNLPNHHKLKQFKYCRVHATAWGDMSTERVYMNPDNLVCVEPNGDEVETTISGFIVDGDGAAGVRGPMITRDAELVQSAIMAGTLSGIGNAISNSQGTKSISPLGSTQTMSTKEMLSADIGKGFGSGLDMLAKYKISQAEKLQPIIQINANRTVDIVLYESATLGEKFKKPVAIAEQVAASQQNDIVKAVDTINKVVGEIN